MILREVNLTTWSLCSGRPDAETASCRQFLFEASCVCDLYLRWLPKLVTKETAKVLIDLREDDDWVVERNIKRLVSVTFSPWNIRFGEYWSLSELERKELVLETLHRGLLWLARIESWPTEPFEIAQQACLERKLVNEFLTKKAVPNPSQTATARLWCEFGPREARITAVIQQGRQERGRVCLGATVPESYCVRLTLASLRWLDDRTLQIQLDHSDNAAPAICDVSPLFATS